MASDSKAVRVGVWGASGSGKSTYVKGRVYGEKRLVIFDPEDEYSRDLPKVARVDRLDDLRAVMASGWGKGFRVAYVPPAGAKQAALERVSRLMLKAQALYRSGADRRGVVFVSDELRSSYPASGGDVRVPGFTAICTTGRHYGITLIGSSQRLTGVHAEFRGNCTETVVFRQKGDLDLGNASRELGLPVSQIRVLENGSFIRECNGAYFRGEVFWKNNKPGAREKKRQGA